MSLISAPIALFKRVITLVGYACMGLGALAVLSAIMMSRQPTESSYNAAETPRPEPTKKSSYNAAETPEPTTTLPVVLDVSQIAGKEKRELAKILGKPTHCEPSRPRNAPRGTRCFYADPNEAEVTFIRRKADWITLNEVTAISFASNIPPRFGLPANRNPTFTSPDVKRWTHIGPFTQMSAFPTPAGHLSMAIFRVTPLE